MTTRFLAKCLVATLALAAGILGVGSVRTPAPPAQGLSLQQEALTFAPITRSTPIRVASFNIHSGRGDSGREDLALTAKTARGFDFIGYQEVYASLRPVIPPQVGLLGQHLTQGWLFAPTERQYWGQRFGNGLTTNLPVRDWRSEPLPSPDEQSRRNVLIVRSVWPGTAITFLVTHITRGADRDVQLRTVEKLFLDQPAPAILLGDFNATSQHPLIQGLLQTPGVGNPVDEKIPHLAGKHIDWIFTRGLQTRDAGTRDLGASDHPLVWAELLVSPSAQPATSPSTQP
jgi:endonuclease/exonuclease/phosphatase family metal-dependent hydrolase